MALVRPFKAIRPASTLARMVAALPYDVMTSDEARKTTEGNPHSFLHVDKAEIDLPEDIDPYAPEVYQKARDNFMSMRQEGVFIQDASPCLYIYRLTMGKRSQTGLVACTSIDEYESGLIKKHELTRADKEQDRIRHVEALGAHTGPIFLAYRNRPEIEDIIFRWSGEKSPVYDFISKDGIGHSVWIINDDAVIAKLKDLFLDIPNLYIADGHHRNASAVKVGLDYRKKNPDYDPEGEFNFYLSVLFPDSQLKIMDYNRLIKDLNGLEPSELLEALGEKFILEEAKEPKPREPHQFGLYMEGKWFRLQLKPQYVRHDDPVGALDVSLLQEHLLGPVLGISDPRTDKRIDFVGGIRGYNELEKRVDSGEMALAITLYPVSMEELMAIADAGAIMPPKSTWFEPKLRSGLFVHDLEI